jgi:hypothetical protein
MGSRKIGSVIKPIKHRGWWKPNGDFFSYDTPPRMTSSLDCIVAEIEARGLDFTLHWDKTGALATICGGKNSYALRDDNPSDTPTVLCAKALCSALLTYLKEPRP